MLINNYGLFWDRNYVFWGSPGVAGHLKGVYVTGKSFGEVDFREQQGIYALYDDGFKLVYVGQAGGNDNHRLFDRLKQHTRDQLAARWSRFSWFGIRKVNNSGVLRAESNNKNPTIGDILNHVEGIMIAVAEPPHNRQGGRFGESVEQYLQFKDEYEVGKADREMLMHLYNASIKEP